MTTNDTPQHDDEPGSIVGDPLLVPPPGDPDALLDEAAEVSAADELAGGATEAPALPPPATEISTPPDAGNDGGAGKLKTGALLAGAAAIANKVRQEAPKQVQRLREKRAEGRCVIVTEVDGQRLAIGPYKDAQAAEAELFKVGGAARVVDLVSHAAFFAPTEASTA